MTNNDIDLFWKAYLRSLPEDQRDQQYFEASSWGNSDELADRIAKLIAADEKTTTSRLEWERQKSNDPLVKAGDKSIVLDAQQRPVCIIETVDVSIIPFDQVDADFVYRYGEGNRDMDFWNQNMWEYYEAECREMGLQASRDMPMICETFRVVYKC